jgi:hypothetical protein
MEYTHGMTHLITEYYIPPIEVFLNNGNGMNIFRLKKADRDDRLSKAKNIEEIDIPDKLVYDLKIYIECFLFLKLILYRHQLAANNYKVLQL